MASTYQISKHSASSYGSLVDRRANRGLPGNISSCTGIDDHELPVLDIYSLVLHLYKLTMVIVNMLMLEYAYYGRGNTIHSLLARLNGSTTHVMTNLTLLEVNKLSHS